MNLKFIVFLVSFTGNDCKRVEETLSILKERLYPLPTQKSVMNRLFKND